MDEWRDVINEQFRKLTPSNVPPHILIPIFIGVGTVLAASALLYKGTEKDVYEPKEKRVIKVEEVRPDTLVPSHIPSQQACTNWNG
jgi:hypothetical protein